MSILSLDGVSYTYTTSSGRQIEAVKAVSFSVESGEYIAVLGRNGSGKSTLARLITGFLEPDAGTVTRANSISGIVFQEPKMQIIASIVQRDTVFGPENLGASKDEAARVAGALLNVVRLSEKVDARTTELSLGQTQKLALAGILAMEPGLLVLDEAVSMIDAATRDEILDFLDERHHAGDTIISITHDISEAMRADRVLAMEDGALIADESVAAFQADTALKERLFGAGGGLNSEQVPSSEQELSKADTRESLRFEDVTFSYPGADKPLFDRLNLAFESGTVTAVMGESGSGKSTLFELAAGLLVPDSGAVRGTSRPALALQECEGALFEVFTADDVAYGPRNAGLTGKLLKERVKAAMQKAGLPFAEFADRPILALSGGEKRRASLAGIIALDSDIIIFDEPCAGLDSVGKRRIADTLRALADEGKTVIFSTHRDEEATVADRVIRITAGAVKADSAAVEATSPDKADSAASAENATALPSLEPLDNGFLSRLKQTSGGVFQNKRSPVSRLPAPTKILLFLALFITSLVFQTWLPCLVMAGVSLVYALCARLPLIRPVKTLLKLLPWLLFFTLIQMLLMPVTADDVLLWQLGILKVTRMRVNGMLKMLLHLVPAIFSLYAFLASTDESDLVDGLKALIPGKTVALTVLVIIRFIPLLADEAALIIKVQLIRGGLKDTRGFINRIRSLLPLFVPLISRTLDRAQDMADALTARYF
ncbi:MAG: ATP-binding cassette domain-containing protein [Treponema sp.]|nr:ATP-binding cassette domain-containing protein [Candidatus Treponema caballi]